MNIELIIGAVVSIVTGYFSHVITKRKYEAEVDGELITNMKESLEFYKVLADDNKNKLEAIMEKHTELLQKNLELQTEIYELKLIIEKMSKSLERCYKTSKVE